MPGLTHNTVAVRNVSRKLVAFHAVGHTQTFVLLAGLQLASVLLKRKCSCGPAESSNPYNMRDSVALATLQLYQEPSGFPPSAQASRIYLEAAT